MKAEISERAAARPIIIKPSQGWSAIGFSSIWEYRELLYFLAWRDIKVRYKQTVLGAAWAVIQPVTTMIVFSMFFGGLAHIPSDGIPYPVFAYAALLPWMYFTAAMSNSSVSLVNSSNLIAKVYFPRLIIPMSAVLAGLLDLAIALTVLIALMLFFGIALTPSILLTPLLILWAAAAALGVGLWLAAMSVKYRDIRYTVPFLTQLWFFATPVAYPSSLVPDAWRSVYGINPMVGVVEGFRWTFLGSTQFSWQLMATSLATTLVLLVSGLFYFRRIEREFADVI